MHHLDTNIIIAYRNGNQTVANYLKMHLPDVALSTLVLAELRYGARAAENLQRLEQLLQIPLSVPYP